MNALQALAVWLGLVAVFMIFWVLLKSGAEHEDDGPDAPPPPPSGA